MIMSLIAFDTHSFVKRLTASGMPEAQAEILAETQTVLIDEKLASKNDLVNLATKADLAELKAATKADLAELKVASKADLAELKVATKTDLAEFRAASKADLAELRAESKADLGEFKLATSANFAEVKSDIKLLKWMMGILIAGMGSLLAGVASLIIKAFLSH